MPPSASIRVYFGYPTSSTCTPGSAGVLTFTQSNQTKSVTGTGYYLCMRVVLGTSNSGVTPSISNTHNAQTSNAPTVQPSTKHNGSSSNVILPVGRWQLPVFPDFVVELAAADLPKVVAVAITVAAIYFIFLYCSFVKPLSPAPSLSSKKNSQCFVLLLVVACLTLSK